MLTVGGGANVKRQGFACHDYHLHEKILAGGRCVCQAEATKVTTQWYFWQAKSIERGALPPRPPYPAVVPERPSARGSQKKILYKKKNRDTIFLLRPTRGAWIETGKSKQHFLSKLKAPRLVHSGLSL